MGRRQENLLAGTLSAFQSSRSCPHRTGRVGEVEPSRLLKTAVFCASILGFFLTPAALPASALESSHDRLDSMALDNTLVMPTRQVEQTLYSSRLTTNAFQPSLSSQSHPPIHSPNLKFHLLHSAGAFLRATLTLPNPALGSATVAHPANARQPRAYQLMANLLQKRLIQRRPEDFCFSTTLHHLSRLTSSRTLNRAPTTRERRLFDRGERRESILTHIRSEVDSSLWAGKRRNSTTGRH